MPFIIDSSTINNIPVTQIGGCGSFSAAKTFDCGQSFRFDSLSTEDLHRLVPDFSADPVIGGVAFGKYAAFAQNSADEGVLTVINATPEECLSCWIPYLSLDTDYDAIDKFLADSLTDEADRKVMTNAISCGRGIRILRQDPWEAVISFIISQNNNIPRIKKIIASLCRTLGRETAFPGTYAFPSAEAICSAGLDGLASLRAGFRGKYILDAAEKVLSGEVDLNAVGNCADYDTALSMLMKINGIGPKVGSCTLLFGFGRTEAFPVDVWMKRSLARHFPRGIDVSAFGKYAGIAQQYLFYGERYLED
ncbi:MAG: DNA-3-methyladenine glycosylase 2 family protein [Ruminococcaceae bacterium]|nr:DNA-3-methyladenine glycosylase 2 family protein [Oscillospiraceae bacterium]